MIYDNRLILGVLSLSVGPSVSHGNTCSRTLVSGSIYILGFVRLNKKVYIHTAGYI